MIKKLIKRLIGKEQKKEEEKNGIGIDNLINAFPQLYKATKSAVKENKKNPGHNRVELDYSPCIDHIDATLKIEYNKLFSFVDINYVIGSIVYFIYPSQLVKVNAYGQAEGIVIGIVLREIAIEINNSKIGSLRVIVKTKDNIGNDIIIKIPTTVITKILYNDRKQNKFGGNKINERSKDSLEHEIIKKDIKTYCDRLCLLDKDGCENCSLNKWK